jgi:chaperonin GroES
MKIKALHNHVVIKQDENQEQTYGRIVVADLGKEKPLQGTIIEIGPGHYTATGVFVETHLEAGQVVVFPSFGGSKISVDGEEYIILKETDLLIALENNTNE